MSLAAVKPIHSTSPKASPKSRSKPRTKPRITKAFSLPGILGGSAFGASIPVLAHRMSEELTAMGGYGANIPSLVVLGCLMYSAPTVYQFMSDCVGEPAQVETKHELAKPAKPASFKALGFVICLESVLVASPVPWCSWFAMLLLSALNGLILAQKTSAYFSRK